MGTAPNLYTGKGYFLRANARPRNTFADTFASHMHEQPAHTHYTTGGLTSTALTADLTSKDVKSNLVNTATSGTAAGQQVTIQDHNHSLNLTYQTAWGVAWDGNGFALTRVDGTISASPYNRTYTAQASQTTGKVNNGAVTAQVTNPRSTGHVTNRNTTGTAHESGGDNTYYTGDDETAPMHYTTRYFIRIND